FSTVMPAVFETAELVRTFSWVRRFATAKPVSASPSVPFGLLFVGSAMLGLTLLWPKYFYPFVWVSLLFILEPLNCWLGRPHFLEYLRHGDRRPLITDRKSTRLNSSHRTISYAVFCLKKKKIQSSINITIRSSL